MEGDHMRAEDTAIWLAPVQRWIEGNASLESDPDEKWHQAKIAWDMLTACFNACALGETPVWTQEADVLDLSALSKADTEEMPVEQEQPSTLEQPVASFDASSEDEKEEVEPAEVEAEAGETVDTDDVPF